MSTPRRLLIVSLAATLAAACAPDAAEPVSAGPDVAPEAATVTASGDGDTSAATSQAGGREFGPETVPLIEGAVKISASAVACGLGTKAQADQGIAAQRATYVERGYSGAEYDRLTEATYAAATERFARASAAEKAQACESMKAFGSQLEQMAKDVQDRQGQQEQPAPTP